MFTQRLRPAQALRGYGYDANSGRWFSLPTSIDAAAHTATIHTSVLTVFALVDTTQGVPVQGAAARATLVTGAIQDPCAIPVALLADSDRNGQSNDFPFRNADRDGNGDVIPKILP
ncbi:MAG: hypothetical protein IPK16_30895 [Anaerolineales bacterium]|nr:hypothetical protein [Anaerolineales bacterium]